MRELVALAVCGILLIGCTSTRSMMISEDTAFIAVLGQNGNDRAKVIDRALAEAARITREHGFRYFVIVDGADASQIGVRLLTGQPIPFRFELKDENHRTNLNTLYSPGATYTTPDERVQYVRLGVDITIRMYHEGEVNPDSQGVWNSDIVLGGK
jgi:hypothetical protein